MPQPSIEPPTPKSVVDWIGFGQYSKKVRTVSKDYLGNPTDRERRRRIAAGRPEWEDFQMEGQPTSPSDVHGAIDILGEGVDPNAVMNQALAYDVITYDDGLGTNTTTAADFYSNEANAWLEEEGFYDVGGPKGYSYQNLGTPPSVIASSVDKAPADITLVPTSSINPPRPRTVGAGYDPWRKCLTVIFRDGTYYNWYGVSPLEWGNFKRARSKGRFIHAYLDGKVRGTADMGGVPTAHQEVLYRVARTAQVAKGGYQAGQKVGSKRGARGAYSSANTASRASRKAQARARAGGSSAV